jgi:predicted CxxxxCH...CXXCH cytochrome family protein
MGSGGAPSCFSASFDGLSCHAGGPVPHPMDGTFLTGSVHGPVAKADLTFCQICHGEAGGAGSNPRFNVGIDSQGSTGCEACHPVNAAHPAVWAGPTANAFHYSAGNIQAACTLCHGTTLDGVGGAVGAVSCLGCHAAPFDGTLDCTFCHGTPPTGILNHVSASAITSHDVCTVCHGMKESTAGGSFSQTANYPLFNKATDTQGDHWDGNINMNAATGYNETNFGCDTALCHGNDAAHQLSDSGLPVVLGVYGAGGAPHPVDAAWLLPSGHVAAADATCLSCHVEDGSGTAPSCLSCHTNGNPLTVMACASCHSAPPNTASTALVDRPDRAGNHNVHDILTADTTTCAACHSGAGTNTLNHFDTTEPANVQFLATYNAASAASYNSTADTCSNVSCHGGVTTPDWNTGTINVYGGGTAGCQQCHKASGETNSYVSGEHSLHLGVSFIDCLSCHDIAVLQTGIAGNSHFSGLATSTFELAPQQTIKTSIGYDGTTCNTPGCHGSQNW